MNPKYNLKVERNVAPEKVKDFTVSSVSSVSSASSASSPSSTPTTVDIRNKISIMYDQGPLGSCTANALCYAYIFDDPSYRPSRLFLYYNERYLDHDVNQDAGSTLSQGIYALEKYGVCSEPTWPYNVSKYTVKPQPDAYKEGVKHEVITANRVLQTMSSLKGCLISGFPFVVGIEIFASFESNTVNKTGYVPLPDINNEELLGGHAVICVGFNDSKGVWIMKNSWGASWGDKGYFYLPYSYLTNPDLSGDAWKITKVTVVLPSKNKLLKMNEKIKFLGFKKGM
jgi:C1A family cysteine protease